MKLNNIEPDDITYNILIALHVRNENYDRCDKLIKEMEENNAEQDMHMHKNFDKGTIKLF